MKLEQLEQDAKQQRLEAMHMAGENRLSIVKGGKKYIYLCDPKTGEVERRVMGEEDPALMDEPFEYHAYIGHGMGAVRD